MMLSSMIVSGDWQEVSVLECVLNGLHIDVQVESEPDVAWQKFVKSKVDAVIVDYDDAGSRAFVEKLQTAGTAPVVIASGSNSRHQLDASGATFIVAKPISVERAVHTLSAARNMIVNERLRYHRQALDLPVTITLESGKGAKGEIINLSQGGAKLRSNKVLSSLETIAMRFTLPGAPSDSKIAGKVTWADEEGFAGIRFVDLDSNARRQLQLWVERGFFQPQAIATR
jgi:CheY-like chemotaxis protein